MSPDHAKRYTFLCHEHTFLCHEHILRCYEHTSLYYEHSFLCYEPTFLCYEHTSAMRAPQATFPDTARASHKVVFVYSCPVRIKSKSPVPKWAGQVFERSGPGANTLWHLLRSVLAPY